MSCLLNDCATVYKVGNYGVEEFTVFGEDDENYIVLPQGVKFIKLPKVKCFDNKMDAMYDNFVKRDKPISNYKGSKYYAYYRERAKKENPELLI